MECGRGFWWFQVKSGLQCWIELMIPLFHSLLLDYKVKCADMCERVYRSHFWNNFEGEMDGVFGNKCPVLRSWKTYLQIPLIKPLLLYHFQLYPQLRGWQSGIVGNVMKCMEAYPDATFIGKITFVSNR